MWRRVRGQQRIITVKRLGTTSEHEKYRAIGKWAQLQAMSRIYLECNRSRHVWLGARLRVPSHSDLGFQSTTDTAI